MVNKSVAKRQQFKGLTEPHILLEKGQKKSVHSCPFQDLCDIKPSEMCISLYTQTPNQLPLKTKGFVYNILVAFLCREDVPCFFGVILPFYVTYKTGFGLQN